MRTPFHDRNKCFGLPVDAHPKPRMNMRGRPPHVHAELGGFTLVEMVVALAITSVLIVTMGSALTLAGRAAPQPDDALTGALRANDTLANIAAELGYAVTVPERTANAVTFTVADRDSDGSPETIRYAWLGNITTPGAVTRAQNGGTPVVVLDNVWDFTLGYTVVTEGESVPGPPVIGSEVLLSSFTGGLVQNDYTVLDQSWPAQSFGFVAPPGATGVSITRVRLNAKSRGTAVGSSLVQLRSTISGKPTGLVWVQSALAESSLTSGYNWVEAPMDEGVVIPLGNLSLVVQHVSDLEAGDFRRGTALTSMYQTINGGVNWSSMALTNLHHYVYGKFVSPGPDVVINHDRCTSVALSLQANAHAGTRAQRSVALRNRPEVGP